MIEFCKRIRNSKALRPVRYLCCQWWNGISTFTPVARFWLMYLIPWGVYSSMVMIFDSAIHKSRYRQELFHVDHSLIAIAMLASSVLATLAIFYRSTTLFRFGTLAMLPFQTYMGVSLLKGWLTFGGPVGLTWVMWLFPTFLGLVLVGTDVREPEWSDNCARAT